MKLFLWVIMGCYIVTFTLMGLGLVAFSFQWIPVSGATSWLQMAYGERNLRLACFLTGGGLILLNWVILQLTIAKIQRQKTIAFDNPDGRVTVSLSAIEDFIRKVAGEISPVKDLRADVVAGKGRILVRARVTLWSEAQIPQVTERIQSLVKTRVQEMLSGIEEPILVRVHVAKIVQRPTPEQASPRRVDQLSTPFRGF